MITYPRKFVIILACMIAACNGAEKQREVEHQQGPSDTPTVQNSPHTGTPAVSVPDSSAQPSNQMPLEKKDSVRIEGSMEPITLKLIRPEGAEPRFMTYMPKDFAFDPINSGEGTGYYFFTNFAGRRNDEAYLLLYVFPSGTTRQQATARVKAFVASRSTTAKPAEYGAFAFTRNGVRYASGIDLRQQGDRFYYVARQYPVEMADGFGPRAAKITDNWKWLP
jgi:hypothetical protein